MMVADRRLWLTADRARVVEDGDPAAAYLLASPGTEVPPVEVERLNLVADKGKIVLPDAKKAAPKKSQPKAKK